MHKGLEPADRVDSGKPYAGQDRSAWVTSGLLLGLAALAWASLVREALFSAMAPGPGMAEMAGMNNASTISAGEPVAFLAAWGVMMAAMMLPSATPMIALYGTLRRNFARTGQKGVPTFVFAGVYGLAWVGFGVPVYVASAAVAWTANRYPASAGVWPYALAAVVLGAGVYQFSSLKQACLRVCQSPVGFLMGHWRGGYRGTLRMAWDHAVYCVGCCWGLMVVLVAAGAMSLPWVLLIAAAVFVEKLFPGGQRLARIMGGALILLAVAIAVQPGLAARLNGPGM